MARKNALQTEVRKKVIMKYRDKFAFIIIKEIAIKIK